MKKIIYIRLAVSAVFASCSKSEVTSAPGADSPITFNPYLGKTPVTKAPVATTDTLGAYGFQVYAFIHTPPTHTLKKLLHIKRILKSGDTKVQLTGLHHITSIS